MGRRVLQLQVSILRSLAIPVFAILLGMSGVHAQSNNDNRGQDQKQPAANAAETAKENQRKTDEFTEAAQALNGNAAGNPECVWLGRRVVALIYADDLDTAFRHLDLYDRFGCPGGHIQAAFRCFTRFISQIDPKAPNSLNNHIHACWINPAAQPPQQAATASTPTPAPAGSQPPPQQPTPQASPQPPAK